MLIRATKRRDLPEFVALYNARLDSTTAAWSEIPETVAGREAWLAAQRACGRPALVAIEDDELVGATSYGDFRDTGRWPGYRPTVEHSIHVREDHWRRGIGRALMQSLMDIAIANGIHVMVGAIDSENVGSI